MPEIYIKIINNNRLVEYFFKKPDTDYAMFAPTELPARRAAGNYVQREPGSGATARCRRSLTACQASSCGGVSISRRA